MGQDVKTEITHVMRSNLPWRAARLTECGLPCKDHPTITVEDFIAKVNREGKQRASYSTCMTCWNTSRRYFGERLWCESPLEREISWERTHRHPVEGPTISHELSAIEDLIDRHRAEFDELVDDHYQTIKVDFSAKKGARPA